MINIVAKITPKATLFDDCKGRLQGILIATRAEPGCNRFELFASKEQRCLFLVEQFVSQAALDEHYAQPYTKAVFSGSNDSSSEVYLEADGSWNTLCHLVQHRKQVWCN